MRFMVTPEMRRNAVLRRIILWSIAFALIFWTTNWLFYLHIGTSYTAIVRYYRGDPATFHNPKSFRSLLEETHFHAFAMLIFLMTFTHLVMLTEIPLRRKHTLVHLAFGSALADMTAGWLIRYVHPAFAWLKMIAFLTLQGVILIMLILILRYLRNAHGNVQGLMPEPGRPRSSSR